jgi:hypothetical protein
MKLYLALAVIVWLICGVTGAWMLGQQRVDLPTIAGGPITLWYAFDKPVN